MSVSKYAAMMGAVKQAISYIGYTAGSSLDEVTLAMPSGSGIGDLAIVFLTPYISNTTPSTPSGWTELYRVDADGNITYDSCYYKTLTATSSVTVGATGGYNCAILQVFRNASMGSYAVTAENSNIRTSPACNMFVVGHDVELLGSHTMFGSLTAPTGFTLTGIGYNSDKESYVKGAYKLSDNTTMPSATWSGTTTNAISSSIRLIN